MLKPQLSCKNLLAALGRSVAISVMSCKIVVFISVADTFVNQPENVEYATVIKLPTV
jgi:hypothetical protein